MYRGFTTRGVVLNPAACVTWKLLEGLGAPSQTYIRSSILTRLLGDFRWTSKFGKHYINIFILKTISYRESLRNFKSESGMIRYVPYIKITLVTEQKTDYRR